jgi:2-polyprenyl-6-methoxyphenol hydroxylase-like FAD-dependent oxidoreductase
MKFIISGGGICGLTMAIMLQRQGHEVVVYEAAPQIKAVGAGLVLSTNAIKALKAIGIADEVLEEGHFFDNFEIKSAKGTTLVNAYSKNFQSKYDSLGNASIHRADLHRKLLSILGDKIAFYTGKRSQSVQQDETGVSLTFMDGTSVKGDYLIASDGIYSPIRQQLLPQSLARFAGYTCWRAVIKHEEGAFNTAKATETWGTNGRFGFVPLTNNRIYWFACINTANVRDEKMKAFTVKDLQAVFGNYHAPIPQTLALTNEEDLLWNDIEDIKPIKKFAFQRILLAGDAAHATTPNMGQGACQAIEDVAVLLKCLKANRPIETAFQQFEKLRLPRTTKIVNDSWTFGKAAQLSNPFLTLLRNTVIQWTPQSINQRQTDFLYNVEF